MTGTVDRFSGTGGVSRPPFVRGLNNPAKTLKTSGLQNSPSVEKTCMEGDILKYPVIHRPYLPPPKILSLSCF